MHRNRLDTGIWYRNGVDFINEVENKLRFYLRDRNRLGFNVGIEHDLCFARGSKQTSILCAG